MQDLAGDAVGALTPELLTALVPDLAQRDAYLRGPPAFAAAARTARRRAGLPERQLHEERLAR